jgi:hypothetical protein
MSDETFAADRERLEKIVQHHAEQLIEHVDSVRIFVTYHRGDESATASYTFGMGNWHAVAGQVKEWVVRQDAATMWAERPDED